MPEKTEGTLAATSVTSAALMASDNGSASAQRAVAPALACGESMSSCCVLDAIFMRISLAANIGILIVVCTVLIAFGSSEPVVYAWGLPTAGRGILLSIYFAILTISIVLLGLHVYCAERTAIEDMAIALLVTQILYKITTPITAGAANPVAISNLCISAFHAVTLFLLWRRRYRQRLASMLCSWQGKTNEMDLSSEKARAQ